MALRYFTEEDARRVVPRCAPDVHKYQRGAVAVFGGNDLYGGAPLLCGTAALYAGAGIVTVCQPASSLRGVPRAIPMALILKTIDEAFFTVDIAGPALEISRKSRVLAIGPGMGRDPQSAEFIAAVLKNADDKAVVLDADALMLTAAFLGLVWKGLPETIRHRVVMTPHAGEFAALAAAAGISPDGDRTEQTRELAETLGCTVLLKGAETVVSSFGEAPVRCANGCPALATAGSGDVLTGCIAALLSAGCAPSDAALLSAWCHGQAARNLSGDTGRFGLIADDLPKEISHVLSAL